MAGDTVGCFYRPRASFQREFHISGSPLLLYNSPPEVDAVLHGHKKPIALEVCSFSPFLTVKAAATHFHSSACSG